MLSAAIGCIKRMLITSYSVSYKISKMGKPYTIAKNFILPVVQEVRCARHKENSTSFFSDT
jgi:hypothetical protein